MLKRSLAFFCLALISSNSFAAFADSLSAPPNYSISGGFYTTTIEVSLSRENAAAIYYTLDGTIPTDSSLLYASPINLTVTTAVRSIVLESDGSFSAFATQTYFISEPINLPVISLVTNPDNLFSDETGIYVTGTNGVRGNCDNVIRNVNQDWERAVNIEFYEKNGVNGLNQQAGIKIFGGCSRTRFPQKSFSLFARKRYGKGEFEYPLFADKDIEQFESFLLRSSADDQVYTMFKDAFAAYSAKDNMDLDYMAYRPVSVYINGQYWGIHNMREKVNEHYFAGNYGVKAKNLNLLTNNASQIYGTDSTYNAMMEFVTSKELSIAENYTAVSKLIDINQYIDYEILNIHLAEVDWPGNNIKFWNATNTEFNKWRWVLYDRDQTYQTRRIQTDALDLATAPNGRGWPNPDWSTLLLRRLLFSQDFRDRFVQTYAYHLSTTFEPDRISEILDEFINRIETEIPRHITRWGGQLDPDKTETWPSPTFNSVEEWESNVEEIRAFLPAREPFAVQHLSSRFSLNNQSELSISSNDAEAGLVQFFEKELPESISASFFNDIPFILKAIAKEGYKFSHWDVGGETVNLAELEVRPQTNMSIVAHFEVNSVDNEPLVINEINYKSPDDKDSGDWVELFNPNTAAVNISGWSIQDKKDKNLFTFPENTAITGNGYLVLCNSVADFDIIFPEVENRIGGLGFKLSNAGEVVRLYDLDAVLIDSVSYLDSIPWPIAADGNGSTLELIDPSMDNNLAESWKASLGNGSPGRFNDELALAINEPTASVHGFMLKQNFPNPVSDGRTILSYSLSKSGNVVLKVFDLSGREIATVIDEFQEANAYHKVYDTSGLGAGLYFVVMEFEKQFIQLNKMMVK